MRLNVELTNELYSDVTVHAGREGRSLSDVVRVLLLDWCKKKKREERSMLPEYQEGNGGDVVLELKRRSAGAEEE